MVIGVAALLLCGCRHVTRVKMAATIHAGNKAYVGSSVQEYSCRKSTHIMNDLDECRIRGEAVVVDVPGDGPVFLIFNYPGAHSHTAMVQEVLNRVSGGIPFDVTNKDLPESWPLSTDQMPMMVRFDNIKDPTSVQQVDPNHLQATFGRDVSDIRVMVEKTSAPVTFGRMERIIPWISNRGNPFHPGYSVAIPFTGTFIDDMSPYDFVWNDKK